VNVDVVADTLVVRLRTGFLKEAIARVRELAAHGEIDEALMAADQVRSYFEWVKEDISPEDRAPIFEQIIALPGTFKPGRDP
jgi:hypothetical protein